MANVARRDEGDAATADVADLAVLERKLNNDLANMQFASCGASEAR